MVEIPVTSDATEAALYVALDDVVYRLLVTWDERAAQWVLDLYTEDDVPIAVGVPILVDFPLLRPTLHARAPLGVLWPRDTSGMGLDPGRYDLGVRVKLYYLSHAEVQEALA